MLRLCWRLAWRCMACHLLLVGSLLAVGGTLPDTTEIQAIAYRDTRTVYLRDLSRGLVIVIYERDFLSAKEEWRGAPTLRP